MSALRSVCCDAPVYLRTGPENNHSSSACICEACKAACTAKLAGHSPIVEVVRELLIEAARVIAENSDSLRECNTVGGQWDSADDEQEYDRLIDLARRLREAANA